MLHPQGAMIQARSTDFSLPLFTILLFGITACSEADEVADTDRGKNGSEEDFVSGDGDQGTGGTNIVGSGGASSGGKTGGSGGVGPSAGGQPNGSGGEGTSTGGSESHGGMSKGCGLTSPPTSGNYTIMVNGKPREYTLDLPIDYNPNTPYSLTFGLHWRGGNSGDVVGNNYYGLKDKANGSMLFVAPQGLISNNTSGWANMGGEDVEFVSLMIERFENELCIDTGRIFATGFSYGGMFSNALGCALADRIRAIAPYAGSLWSGCEEGSSPVAYFGTHGTSDNVVEIPNGRDARDEFIARNGCTTETTPYGANGCVSYKGCQEGYPVVWCEYNDGHWWPAFAPDEVWNFFSQF